MGNFVTGLFYGPAKFSATTPKLEMDLVIRAKEAYLGAVNWFHALIWYLSISMTLVPGERDQKKTQQLDPNPTHTQVMRSEALW